MPADFNVIREKVQSLIDELGEELTDEEFLDAMIEAQDMFNEAYLAREEEME